MKSRGLGDVYKRQVPRVHLLSELPMTATGKIRKNDLPSPQQLS